MKILVAIAQVMIAGVLLAAIGPAGAQQAYPSKSIRLILPFTPGGSTDVLTRVVAQKLSENWGQPVILDNRPGGNGTIGVEILAKSPPDGLTIMQTSTITHVTAPMLVTAPYDPIKDFAPVCTLATSSYILLVHPSVSANTLQEFIALAKSKPGQLNYSSGGNGTGTHLWVEVLKTMTGIKINHIPYKGMGAALNDLIGGHVQMSLQSPIQAIPFLKAGKLKGLATTGKTRESILPQVPTFIEAGLPGFEATTWFIVLAPAGTPKEIIATIHDAIAKVMAAPDTKEKLEGQAMFPVVIGPEELAAKMKAHMATFGKIIKAANIKPT